MGVNEPGSLAEPLSLLAMCLGLILLFNPPYSYLSCCHFSSVSPPDLDTLAHSKFIHHARLDCHSVISCLSPEPLSSWSHFLPSLFFPSYFYHPAPPCSLHHYLTKLRSHLAVQQVRCAQGLRSCSRSAAAWVVLLRQVLGPGRPGSAVGKPPRQRMLGML